jgi:hypothetical protein
MTSKPADPQRPLGPRSRTRCLLGPLPIRTVCCRLERAEAPATHSWGTTAARHEASRLWRESPAAADTGVLTLGPLD